MKKINVMHNFFKEVIYMDMLDNLLMFLYKRKDLNWYNYIFRISLNDDRLILDIFDNITINRYNRYIYDFKRYKKSRVFNNNGIYVYYIYIKNKDKINNNFFKLGYMFSLEKKEMIEYGEKILDKELFNILMKILNNPI